MKHRDEPGFAPDWKGDEDEKITVKDMCQVLGASALVLGIILALCVVRAFL